ncbi:hypothetical protein C0J52_18820 [Blattella germanica]|nr:hypothetical protein C0J52_18820 [Blattella germanica]
MDPADHCEPCRVCGLSGRTWRCARCKVVFYCSKGHQEQDWRRHRRFCKNNLVDKSDDASAPEDSVDAASENDNVNIKPKEEKADQENDSETLEAVSAVVDAEIAAGLNKKIGMENDKKDELVNGSSDTWGVGDSEGAVGWNISPIVLEGSSESEILNAVTENLNPSIDYNSLDNSLGMPSQEVPIVMAPKGSDDFKHFPEVRLPDEATFPPFFSRENRERIEEISRHVVRDMERYGVCVIDNFLGAKLGLAVLDEVKNMYSKGVFKDGQLVSHRVTDDLKTIRSDQITWLDGKESECKNIGMLITQVDNVIACSNNRRNRNGKLGDYTISGRTKVCGVFIFYIR